MSITFLANGYHQYIMWPVYKDLGIKVSSLTGLFMNLMYVGFFLFLRSKMPKEEADVDVNEVLKELKEDEN